MFIFEETAVTTITLSQFFELGCCAIAAWAGKKAFDLNINANALVEEEEEVKYKDKKPKKENNISGGPPRDGKTSNYLPDPAAEGTPHTTLGTKTSQRSGPYKQGATFDADGKFKGRTDLTNHNRRDHPNPHYHPATTPNSAKTAPQCIPEI